MAEVFLPESAWQFLRQLLQEQRHTLERDGECSPLIVALGPGRTMVLKCHEWEAETKHQIMREAGRLTAHLSPLAVAIVADTYLRESPADGPQYTGPQDDPRTKEAMVLAVMTVDGRMWTEVHPYRREVIGLAVQIVWEEPLPGQEHQRSDMPLLRSYWAGVSEALPGEQRPSLN